MSEEGSDMSKRNVQRDVLNTINKKAKKKVTQKEIQKLASTKQPSTLQSEAQLRRLIKQVASMANVPVSESTIREIIQAVKSSGMNPQQMESMMKMMLRKIMQPSSYNKMIMRQIPSVCDGIFVLLNGDEYNIKKSSMVIT